MKYVSLYTDICLYSSSTTTLTEIASFPTSAENVQPAITCTAMSIITSSLFSCGEYKI